MHRRQSNSNDLTLTDILKNSNDFAHERPTDLLRSNKDAVASWNPNIKATMKDGWVAG